MFLVQSHRNCHRQILKWIFSVLIFAFHQFVFRFWSNFSLTGNYTFIVLRDDATVVVYTLLMRWHISQTICDKFFHLKRNEITFFIPSVRFDVATNVANENRWHHLDSINNVHSHTHPRLVRDNEMFIFTRSKSVHKLKSIEEVHWLWPLCHHFPSSPPIHLTICVSCCSSGHWSIGWQITTRIEHFVIDSLCQSS